MYTVNIIAGDKQQDAFMHAADVFEPFKRLGQALSIEFEDDHVPCIENLQKIKDTMEKGGYVVSSLWYPQKPELNIIDWNIKVISNGEKWCMHHDYLKQFGIVQKKE